MIELSDREQAGERDLKRQCGGRDQKETQPDGAMIRWVSYLGVWSGAICVHGSQGSEKLPFAYHTFLYHHLVLRCSVLKIW